MKAKANEDTKEAARKFWSEAHEMLLIFGKIESKSREK